MGPDGLCLVSTACLPALMQTDIPGNPIMQDTNEVNKTGVMVKEPRWGGSGMFS